MMSHRTDADRDASWDSARRQLQDARLSVLMPAHNLAPTIARNVRHVRDLFSSQLPFEIVVIDDGSTDGTADELRRLAGEVPELRAVILPGNAGKGAALRRGFEACTGRIVAFVDADLDLSPGQLARFFDIMEQKDADIVIGSKRHEESVLRYPWQRRLMSAGYYFLVKLMFGLPIRDTQTGLKLFKREALAWVFPRMLVKQFAFDLEILAIAHEKGFRIAEAPVTVDYKGPWGQVRLDAARSVLNDTLAVFYRLRILRYYQAIPDVRIPEPRPLISVVVAYPSESAYLRELLDGLSRQTYSDMEVVLLPDVAAGHAWPEKVREIPTGRRRPAEKRNLGLRHVRGEIVAFIDDDAFPADDWLERALGHFSDPEVAAVGGPAGTPPTDPYMAQLSGRVYANWLVSGVYRYRYQPRRVRHVDDYPSCNLFVRTGVLKALGGFRTDFWPGEDTYLCMEIVHRLKKKILYEPRALVYHHRRTLFLPHLRQIGRYGLHRGYFARHFPTTSRRLGYMAPSLFVLGLAGGGILSVFLPWLRWPYSAALLAYAVLTLLFAASRSPLTWFLTWLGIALTHVVYGVRFLMGYVSGRLPGEVQRFDHPTEEVAR